MQVDVFKDEVVSFPSLTQENHPICPFTQAFLWTYAIISTVSTQAFYICLGDNLVH